MIRELPQQRPCRQCGILFVTGSLTGKRYCSVACREDAQNERRRGSEQRKATQRKYKAKRKQEFVGKGQDNPGSMPREIPDEVLALGLQAPRDAGVTQLVEEVRRLGFVTPEGREWWGEWLDEIQRLTNRTTQRDELRRAVDMLGGNTEA